MSQSSRPPKRPRDDEADPQTSPLDDLKRSEEFWLEDGNIVLVAGEVAFRVYRGLLGLQSTIFADLFASSSPNAEETYADCPVIRLTDSPQDLAHLLRVLFPTSRTLLYRRKEDPDFSFHEIAAIVRLAHKYHIEDLLSQALSSLQDYYTSSFKVWDSDYSGCVSFEKCHAIGVVNLARLTDTPSLLLIALYMCCALGSAVMDGWAREDGTVEHLTPQDLKCCVGARNSLAKEAFSFVSTVFKPVPSRDCIVPVNCETALRGLLAMVLEHDQVADATVLGSWASVIRGDDGEICSACEQELIARDRKERERIWNRLPEIFEVEVEGWNANEDETTDDDDEESEEQ